MSIDHQMTHPTSWPIQQTPDHSLLRQVFELSRGKWKGCDWEAPLGPEGIRTRGLRGRHAHLLSAATSGEEAAAWLDAARYLETLEAHAKQAESAANEAVQLAEADRWSAAIERMQFAVELEAQYRVPEAWMPLMHLIKELASRCPSEQ